MRRAVTHNESEIAQKIYLVRGRKVMLDSDLAKIYGVTTSRMNEQYRRNKKRFPEDFAFQLTTEEFTNLMSQIATSSLAHGGRRKPPVVFSEHGAIMLASVLNSPLAIEASVRVVRAFIKLRELLSTNAELKNKLKALERKLDKHDEDLQLLFEAIKQLLQPVEEDEQPRRQIGFHVKNQGPGDLARKVGI